MHSESDIGDRFWRFHGGIHVRHWKRMSIRDGIPFAGIPDELVIPLRQQLCDTPELNVRVGDRVLRGTPLTRLGGDTQTHLHATSSGIITAIEPRPVIHASGLDETCVVIRTDGKDESEHLPLWDHWQEHSADELRQRMADAGVVGLGGALFPTHVKGEARLAEPPSLLIINGAECEPYIASDESLMRWRPEQVLLGAQMLSSMMGAEQCVIAIEDQMGEVEHNFMSVLKALQIANLKIIRVPTIYPEGGERQLIQVLTSKEVPADGLPQDLGIVVQNVGTAAAAYQAIADGQPVVSRIVTVTGRGVQHPLNVEARIGTPVEYLTELAGGYTEDARRLIMGGPLMGVALPDDARPITKACNCILVLTEADVKPMAPEMPCIRCGKCADVCPAQLLPQQLLWHIRAGEYDDVASLDLESCIECGCCAYVCPSQIPLVQYYRHGKTELVIRREEREASEKSRQRYEHREQRLQLQKQERRERLERKRSMAGSDKSDEIKAAIARAQARRNQQNDAPGENNNDEAET